MKTIARLQHEFVENIPETLEAGTVYISIEYSTAVHKCCCGCGNEVVTPLSPTDWKLIFDGETISLEPSIGNWSFDCESHYWIESNIVRWASSWSRKQIEAGRARDRWAKKRYFENKLKTNNPKVEGISHEMPGISESNDFWSSIKKWWS